jgi:hypothetical protein
MKVYKSGTWHLFKERVFVLEHVTVFKEIIIYNYVWILCRIIPLTANAPIGRRNGEGIDWFLGLFNLILKPRGVHGVTDRGGGGGGGGR